MGLGGETCLVLGSAPRAKVPATQDYSKCLCVNGSPFIANKHSISVDLTVLAGFTTAMTKDISILSMERLEGLHSDDLVFINGGDTFEHCISTLKDRSFTFHTATEITPIERAAIVGEVCGRELGLGRRDDRISNGVFAVALALWAGAEGVIMSGISLSGGHDYANDTPRHHLTGDTTFLTLMAGAPRKVTTTSHELSRLTGLPFHLPPRGEVG